MSRHVFADHWEHCDQCEESFATISLLNQHVRIIHMVEKDLTCVVCDKVFDTEDNVEIHLEKDHKDFRIITTYLSVIYIVQFTLMDVSD